MKLAVLQAPQQFDVIEVEVPAIGPDQVLLRVAACGVCGSELDMWHGASDRTYPIHPGHEVSGVVEKTGSEVDSLRPGDRVAAWVTERGFSEYVAVNAAFCLPSGDLPLDLALAEPLACAVNAVELADPQLGDDVLLVGAGFMGALILKLMGLRGPRLLIAADTRPSALELASRLGATHTIDVTCQPLAETVKSLTDRPPTGVFGAVDPMDELGTDVSFEVTGFEQPLVDVGDATRMAGKLVIVGYHQGGTRAVPLGAWNWKALKVVNAHFREVATIMHGMRIGMRLLVSGRIRLDDLVTHRYSLDEVGEAFAVAYQKPDGFLKSTVVVSES